MRHTTFDETFAAVLDATSKSYIHSGFAAHKMYTVMRAAAHSVICGIAHGSMSFDARKCLISAGKVGKTTFLAAFVAALMIVVPRIRVLLCVPNRRCQCAFAGDVYKCLESTSVDQFRRRMVMRDNDGYLQLACNESDDKRELYTVLGSTALRGGFNAAACFRNTVDSPCIAVVDNFGGTELARVDSVIMPWIERFGTCMIGNGLIGHSDMFAVDGDDCKLPSTWMYKGIHVVDVEDTNELIAPFPLSPFARE
jgi:hypothetical protein